MKVHTVLESVFFGTKPKRTVVCSQSFNYATTVKGECSAETIFLGTEPQRTVVCNQSSNYAKTLQGE